MMTMMCAKSIRQEKWCLRHKNWQAICKQWTEWIIFLCRHFKDVQVERSKNWSTPPNVDAQKQYFRGFLPPILSRQTSKNTNWILHVWEGTKFCSDHTDILLRVRTLERLNRHDRKISWLQRSFLCQKMTQLLLKNANVDDNISSGDSSEQLYVGIINFVYFSPSAHRTDKHFGGIKKNYCLQFWTTPKTDISNFVTTGQIETPYSSPYKYDHPNNVPGGQKRSGTKKLVVNNVLIPI